jgi:hypothetical protein
MKDWIESEIARAIDKYGDVPPLWIIFPDEHPYSICWRMGYGEGYVEMWGQWWQQQNWNEFQRITYFRQWTPPYAWLEWTIEAIWDLRAWEETDFDYLPYFDRLETLGFGSQKDYERDLDDPKWLDREDEDDVG